MDLNNITLKDMIEYIVMWLKIFYLIGVPFLLGFLIVWIPSKIYSIIKERIKRR